MYTRLLIVAVFCFGVNVSVDSDVPPYIKQCRDDDPELISCFISALHHLRPYLKQGIPDVELPTIEPFRMDDLSLSLTGGPNGYKITLKELDVYGATNYTVTRMKLSENGRPFEATIKMPHLKIKSRYMSSGVLIILPASGNGTFHSTIDGVTAVLTGTVSNTPKNGLNYLNVETLDVKLAIKNVNMQVKKIFNNNRVLIEATNLFLRENGHEVLNLMMPQLQTKLAEQFQRIANKLLTHVPVQMFLVAASNR